MGTTSVFSCAWARRALIWAAMALPMGSAWAAHGYGIWGELKYPDGFQQFDYVDPAAPKGGELRMVSNLRLSTFDKYNPFTLRGSYPAFISSLMFESLLTGSLDENGTGYGLLAEDVSVAPDRLSATFRLRREARFNDGSPVLAADVKHSYDTLIGPHVNPGYKTILVDVAGLDVIDERTVRYRFKKPNRELPLTVGGLPVFSRAWGNQVDPKTGQRKTFDEVVVDAPIASGPYIIGPVKFGRDITYVRDANYWAKDLPARKGQFNFDRITVKIYKDNTAKLEALKAGEFDFMRIFSAGDWARRITGKRFDTGELKKEELKHRLPTGFQSYVLNTRKPLLQDVHVRQALGLALDYEWMNRQMFYGGYQRVQGLFGSTDCAASGLPSEAELALLKPWEKSLPTAVFGPMAVAPRTDGDSSLRGNLKQAQAILKAAGWSVRDGVLTNAEGTPFELEYLASDEGGVRSTMPWVRNLEKLGVKMTVRVVDFALYQEKLRTFDFDVITLAFGGTHTPGAEYAELFGSEAAKTPDSGNYFGVANAAIDDVLKKLAQADTRPDFLTACRALERVVAHSHLMVPQWSGNSHRIVFNQRRLGYKSPMPVFAEGEDWVLSSWWTK
ncbi:extracellular solute-binding protein [Hydrogenophaga crassostreae]